MKSIIIILLTTLSFGVLATNNESAIESNPIDQNHISTIVINKQSIGANELLARTDENDKKLNVFKAHLYANMQNIKNIKTRIDLTEEFNINVSKLRDEYATQKTHTQNLEKQLISQQDAVADINQLINDLKTVANIIQAKVNNTNKKIKINENKFSEFYVNLNQTVSVNEKTTSSQFKDMDIKVSTKFKAVVTALVSSCLFLLIIIILIRIKMKQSNTALENKIKSAKASLEEESLSLDNKLIEVLEKQIKVQKEKKEIISTANEEVDHSLSIKVADEIIRMQKNIARMDSSVKGLKPLLKGIERIKSNFEVNGYEIIDLLNQDYNERTNLDVIEFIENINLDEGSSIISKVIRPQVNYNGVLIQRAQVEVSQN